MAKHTITFNPETDDLIEKYNELLDKSNKRIILFNKESGAYVSTVITDTVTTLNSTHYKWKVEYFDDKVYEWSGDYDTGKLVKIEDQPTAISEAMVDTQIGAIVTESYPWFSQCNIMMQLLKKLVEESAIAGDEVDEFNQMFDFIEGRREQNRKYKTAYAEDPSFKLVTRRDEWDLLGKQLAGGVSEIVGPSRAVLPHEDMSNDVDVDGQHY